MNRDTLFQEAGSPARHSRMPLACVAIALVFLCRGVTAFGGGFDDGASIDPLLATEKKLLTPAPADFESARLDTAIDSLGAASGLVIHPDWDELKPLGVLPENTITLKAKGLDVAGALAKVIATPGSPQAAHFGVVSEGVVEVSSQRRIEFLTTETRVYDISDLLGEADVTVGSGANPKSRTKTIVDAIISKVGAPGDWEINSGKLSSLDIIQSKMFVRTPRQNQAQVSRVLASLRAPGVKDPKPDERSIGRRTRGADPDPNVAQAVVKAPPVATRPAPAAKPVEKTLALQPAAGHDVYAVKTGNKPAKNQLHQTPELPVGVWTVQGEMCYIRSFIKFDELSQIPKSAKIVSANLCLAGAPSSLVMPQGNSQYPQSPYSETPDNICVVERLVDHDWDEGTITYDNQPPSTPVDRAVVASSNTRWRYDVSADVTAQVQEMVSNPSKNFGFVIKMQTESTYRSMVFISSTSKAENFHPKLVIVYQLKAGGS